MRRSGSRGSRFVRVLQRHLAHRRKSRECALDLFSGEKGFEPSRSERRKRELRDALESHPSRQRRSASERVGGEGGIRAERGERERIARSLKTTRAANDRA